MPKISQIDEVPCQAEVRILRKITLKRMRTIATLVNYTCNSFMKLTPDLDSVSDWSLHVGNFASTNQTLPRSDQLHVISMEFLRSAAFLRRHFAGKPVVASRTKCLLSVLRLLHSLCYIHRFCVT